MKNYIGFSRDHSGSMRSLARAAAPAKKPASKENVRIEAFTNHLEQVIFPDQKVIIVTTGYSHRVSVRQGIYVGLSPSGRAICEYVSNETVWLQADGTEGRRWKSGAKSAGQRPFKRRTSLPAGRIYITT
jgi:hypothetical protein